MRGIAAERLPPPPPPPPTHTHKLSFAISSQSQKTQKKTGDCLSRTVEVVARVVEQHHPDLAAVVLVDDAGAGVDELLHGQAGARGDPGIGACGRGDGEARGDDGAVAGRDDDVLAAGCFLEVEEVRGGRGRGRG